MDQSGDTNDGVHRPDMGVIVEQSRTVFLGMGIEKQFLGGICCKKIICYILFVSA